MAAQAADDRANDAGRLGENGLIVYSSIIDTKRKEVVTSGGRPCQFTAKQVGSEEQTIGLVSKFIIPKVDGSEQIPGIFCKTEKNNVFYVSHQELGVTVIFMTTPEYKINWSLIFEQRVYEALSETPQSGWATFLKTTMDSLNKDPPMNEKLKAVYESLEETKSQIIQNMKEEFERHQAIDIANEQSENLADSSRKFASGAHVLEKKLWWQNMKCYLWIALAVLILLGVLITVICVVAKCGS